MSRPHTPLLFCLGFIGIALAAPVQAAGKPLDQEEIQAQYREGNFETVIRLIENYLALNPTLSRRDSIFIFKHLGVVHAANPDTREKGRYYLHRLLDADPEATLLDMFVSEEIDRIFAKVRKENAVVTGGKGAGASTESAGHDPGEFPLSISGRSDIGPGGGRSPPENSADTTGVPANRKWWSRTLYWAAGGGALAVAAGIYFLFATSGSEAHSIGN